MVRSMEQDKLRKRQQRGKVRADAAEREKAAARRREKDAERKRDKRAAKKVAAANAAASPVMNRQTREAAMVSGEDCEEEAPVTNDESACVTDTVGSLEPVTPLMLRQRGMFAALHFELCAWCGFMMIMTINFYLKVLKTINFGFKVLHMLLICLHLP